MRAPHWWYFTPLPLTSLAGPQSIDAALLVRCAGGMIVTALCLAYAYGLNGIADRAMDRNQAKNSLAGISGVPREAALLVALCVIGALAVAAALSPVALRYAAISLVAGTFYSSLLRLKRLPVIGTVVNVFIFAPLPLLAVSGSPPVAVLFLTYCFWVLVTQNQILHEVSDAAEDEAAGVRTTGVVVGLTGVRLLAVMLGPLAIVPLWSLPVGSVTRLAAAIGLCGGAVMVALCDRDRARQLRFSHRWYSLLVGMTLFALLTWGGGV
jgi:4-hydroxybenzoate polyprenyltransferase